MILPDFVFNCRFPGVQVCLLPSGALFVLIVTPRSLKSVLNLTRKELYVLQKNAMGKELFEVVKQKLGVEEADYFSLSYRNSANLRVCLCED